MEKVLQPRGLINLLLQEQPDLGLHRSVRIFRINTVGYDMLQ